MKPLSSASSCIGATAPASRSHSGSRERRPIASTTRSASSSSPDVVRTPVTCGTPVPLRASSRSTPTPRRTSTRGSASAALPITCSTVVRRAVIVPEPVVARARHGVGDRRRHPARRVDRDGAGADQRVEHVRQLIGQHVAPAGVQVVGEAELGDAGALPPLPRLAGRGGHGGGIALEHRHVVPVARQHHRAGEAAHPAAEDHDRCHECLRVSPPPGAGSRGAGDADRVDVLGMPTMTGPPAGIFRHVTVAEACLLVAAGMAGGLAGSIAGLASLFTYPALLATGLGPIAANVTNTVSLVGASVGSVSASRPELSGQRTRLVPLAAAGAAGGAAGAGLLLLTPDATFERIAPWLIAGASLAILFGPQPAAADGEGGARAAPGWRRGCSPSRSTAATSAPPRASCCSRCC